MGECVGIQELNTSSGEYFRPFSLVPGIKFIYVKKPQSSESGQHHLVKLFCLCVLIHVLWEEEGNPWAGWDFWGITNFHIWWPREAVPAIMQQIFHKITCVLESTIVNFSSLCCVRVDICSSSWLVKPVVLQVCLKGIVLRASEVSDHLRSKRDATLF